MLGLLSYGLKYIAAKGILFPGRRMEGRRLEVVETLALDTRRRLVMIRRDDREHLLLLGANQDIVVEANLPPRPLASLPPSTD
jgi:flagellar protein FliO/FliZ